MSDLVKLQNLGNAPLSFDEARELLKSPKDVSNVPAVKPKAGFGYFFQGGTEKSKNDFVCDQYRFYADGQHNRRGVLKRYYKIKAAGQAGRAVSSSFQRHVFTLSGDKHSPPICLVHYFGDETAHIDSTHGNAKKKTGIYLPTMKSVMDKIAQKVETKKPKNVYNEL